MSNRLAAESGETTSTRDDRVGGAAWLRAAAPAVTEAHALVVAWALEEPERVGEVILLADDSPPQIFGRGGPDVGDDAPRARLLRQTQGGVDVRPPLTARGLSRRQLRLAPAVRVLRFERLGRCETRHNGRPCEAGVLEPGDVLTVDEQLVLFCTRRTTRPACPARGEALRRSKDAFPFGGPDADGIVGESDAVVRLREELAVLAASGMHVLVLGESGTGKELAARALHRMSARAGRAFVARSAAAIPTSLLDAELFGNRRDYPNSGMPEREGLVGAAHGGTLFLDEIGELSTELQSHLLRLLDAGGEYHRLGEALARRSDLRLVAATNRSASDLKHDFAARFPLRLSVPGLDARREDIPLLLHNLIVEAAAAHPSLVDRFFDIDSSHARVDPAYIEALLRWPWTTHVRELRALLWASLRSSRGGYLTVPPEMGGEAGPRAVRPARSSEPSPIEARDPNEPSAEAIRQALAEHGGNQSRAYAALGLPSRFALYRLLRKNGIDARDVGRRR